MVTKRNTRNVTVKTDVCTMNITMPNGKEHRITVYNDGKIMIHALSGFTSEVCIGCASENFKVSDVNDNGSVYALKKE